MQFISRLWLCKIVQVKNYVVAKNPNCYTFHAEFSGRRKPNDKKKFNAKTSEKNFLRDNHNRQII